LPKAYAKIRTAIIGNSLTVDLILINAKTRRKEIIKEIITVPKLSRKTLRAKFDSFAENIMAKLKSIMPRMSENIDSHTINSFLSLSRFKTPGITIALLITDKGMAYKKAEIKLTFKECEIIYAIKKLEQQSITKAVIRERIITGMLFLSRDKSMLPSSTISISPTVPKIFR
jgi:hypothetical protein